MTSATLTLNPHISFEPNHMTLLDRVTPPDSFPHTAFLVFEDSTIET